MIGDFIYAVVGFLTIILSGEVFVFFLDKCVGRILFIIVSDVLALYERAVAVVAVYCVKLCRIDGYAIIFFVIDKVVDCGVRVAGGG